MDSRPLRLGQLHRWCCHLHGCDKGRLAIMLILTGAPAHTYTSLLTVQDDAVIACIITVCPAVTQSFLSAETLCTFSEANKSQLGARVSITVVLSSGRGQGQVQKLHTRAAAVAVRWELEEAPTARLHRRGRATGR